jgi:glucosylceramidase
MFYFHKILVLFFVGVELASAATRCNPRDFGHGSAVCVCDAQSCDSVEPVEPVKENQAVVYTSDKSGQRLDRTTLTMRTVQIGAEQLNITLDSTQQYQYIDGFGGAFTDAAGINIAALPQSAQDFLLKSYFSSDGIEYTIGRIPISSADFSTRTYSYDDVANDFNLTHFALVDDDLKYKIPYIKAAQNYSSRPIRLFGSSWSAPAWMKTSGRMDSNGTLLGEPKVGDPYYTTWANYYVRFLQEYAKHNITMWALTAQNEPTTGFLYNYAWQTQAFTAEMQRDFIKYSLGPALHNNGFEDVSIMILDDQRLMLPSWAKTVLKDREVRKYISHIAVHFYMDRVTPTQTLEATHKEFPNFPMIGTEACVGTMGGLQQWEPHVILGSWERAELYAQDIIEDLNHWFVGWVDWNLALDLEGGPNWAKNFVDSPIIVNATSGEFFKQPMFYAMGHFSKFLTPKSYRIGLQTNINAKKVDVTAFTNADGYKTVIALNKNNDEIDLTVGEKGKDQVLDLNLPPRSLVTVLWK